MASVDHKPVFSPAQIAAALAVAPHRVDDPECPYDPNTPDAVAIHWANAMTSQSLPELQEKLARRRSKPLVKVGKPESIMCCVNG